MTVRAIVFAYNRQPMLDRLLSKLGGIPTLVMDDASKPELRVPNGVDIRHANRNFGRAAYWKTVTIGLQQLRKADPADYYLFLADDLDPVPGAVDRAIQLMRKVRPEGWAVNLIRYPYDTNWRHTLRKYGAGMHTNGWVDGCFICPRSTLEALEWKIHKVHPSRFRTQGASSGVWSQVTARIYTLGGVIFSVNKTLFRHGDHPSKMHPEERLKNPLKV